MVRYTPQQNGVAKRDNRTLVEGARTLLHSKTFLPLRLWAEAVNCVVYTLNRSLSSSCPAVTPFETWFYRKPDVSNLRPFGSEFYVMVDKGAVSKTGRQVHSLLLRRQLYYAERRPLLGPRVRKGEL